MKLRDYLKETGIKQYVFAQKVGVTPLTIRYLMEGKKDFCLSLACRIEDVTDKQVTCRDIVNPSLVRDYEKRAKELKGRGSRGEIAP